MRRLRHMLPLVLVATVAARGGRSRDPSVTEALSEAAITTWIWHVEPNLAEPSLPTFRDLLVSIPADARLLIALGSGVDVEVYCDRLGLGRHANGRVTLLDGGDKLSPWARDRYVIFTKGDQTCILLPRPDAVAPDKVGDLATARWLAESDPGLTVLKSEFDLEGGDVLVTDDHVFVGVETILTNAARLGGAAVEARLESLFERKVVVVGKDEGTVPHVHLDMFLTIIGRDLLLLGDPRLAEGYFQVQFEPDAATTEARAIGTFTRETQSDLATLYDALAEQLKRAGFRVERIPILHTEDDNLVTWNNAVTERRGREAHAYVPEYGIPALDRMAHERWKKLGYKVHGISVARVIPHGGAVRCLSNVLRVPKPEGQLDGVPSR